MAIKERFSKIEILRFIAMILVLIGHTIILFPINLHEISWCKAIAIANEST